MAITVLCPCLLFFLSRDARLVQGKARNCCVVSFRFSCYMHVPCMLSSKYSCSAVYIYYQANIHDANSKSSYNHIAVKRIPQSLLLEYTETM